jgi:hypothetical protein
VSARGADEMLLITDRPAADWVDPTLPKAKSAEACLRVAAALTKPGAGSAVVAGPWAPWGVQVAGSFSLERAMAGFAAIQRKYSAIVSGPPMVVCSLDRSHGQTPLFQIRLPALDQKQATDICHRLEAVGGACIVFRNRDEAHTFPLSMAKPFDSDR